MSGITIQKQDNILHLSGILDCRSLNQLWQKKTELFTNIERVNVAKLTRVDSAGLALLTYFCIEQNLKLTDLNKRISMLITLYDLDEILV